MRLMLNLYPPFLCGRIRLVSVGPGCRTVRVVVKRSLLTRNLNGTTFGGTISTAADPIYSVLYWQALARRGEVLQVWLKGARIDFRRPAATALTLDFEVTEADLDEALAVLDRDGRVVRTHRTEAFDRAGELCAVIETDVYMRRPRGGQREVSGF